MKWKTYALALCVPMLFSCAGNKNAPVATAPTHDSATNSKPAKKFVSIEEFMTTMKDSPVRYALEKDSTSRTELKLFSNESQKANPEWRIIQDSASGTQLTVFKSNKCSSQHSKKALDAMDDRNYDLALTEYQAAYGCDAENHKLLTYIGNIHFMLDHYDSAIVYFSSSLQKNPHDYQAHYFIADAYARKGEMTQARSHLIKALMYNGRSANVLGFANNLLDDLGETIDYKRLNFGFQVSQTDTAVLIHTSNDDHVIMGMCFAGLQYDPAYEEFRKQDDEIFQNRLRNCLLAQITYAQYQLDQGKLIDTQSQYLINVLKDGYLQAMIYWEMGANLYPQILYILPDEERQKVESYISKYVIRKKI